MDPSRRVRCDSSRRDRSPRTDYATVHCKPIISAAADTGPVLRASLAMNCQATIIRSLRDKGASPFAVSLVRRFADTLSLELLELLM
jgi:hypothetical protein